MQLRQAQVVVQDGLGVVNGGAGQGILLIQQVLLGANASLVAGSGEIQHLFPGCHLSGKQLQRLLLGLKGVKRLLHLLLKGVAGIRQEMLLPLRLQSPAASAGLGRTSVAERRRKAQPHGGGDPSPELAFHGQSVGENVAGRLVPGPQHKEGEGGLKRSQRLLGPRFPLLDGGNKLLQLFPGRKGGGQALPQSCGPAALPRAGIPGRGNDPLGQVQHPGQVAAGNALPGLGAGKQGFIIGQLGLGLKNIQAGRHSGFMASTADLQGGPSSLHCCQTQFDFRIRPLEFMVGLRHLELHVTLQELALQPHLLEFMAFHCNAGRPFRISPQPGRLHIDACFQFATGIGGIRAVLVLQGQGWQPCRRPHGDLRLPGAQGSLQPGLPRVRLKRRSLQGRVIGLSQLLGLLQGQRPQPLIRHHLIGQPCAG